MAIWSSEHKTIQGTGKQILDLAPMEEYDIKC